jgi:hypothetical protein
MNRRRNSNVKPTRESFEMTSLDVCGDFAIESGRAKRTQYLSIWKRQPDGVWRIQKDMWNGQESPSEAAAKAPAAAVSSPQSAPPEVIAPVSDTIPIPDPRPLSEGFARGIGDQLRTRAAKIRLLRTTGGSEDARRAATTRADRELQKIIRNIGWIDVNRFGVRTSCDAAYIVAESGDPALVRSTVPLMKDLEQNPEGNGCYQPALEAYRKIAGR